MPRTPNLNALRMFDAAARHLNFRRAAEELNLTQGAVAQQVRALERDLGLRLFDRKARGLALTDIGRRYHDPIYRALALIDDATTKLRPDSTRVTLSVPPSFASKWLVPRLGVFLGAHPEIDLRIMAGENLADFQSDGVDLSIRQGGSIVEPGTSCQRLSLLDLQAVCAPGLAYSMPPIQCLEDFAARNLVQDSHGLWEMLFERAGIAAPARMIQFNQTALAMDAAANGQGIALAPRLLLDGDLALGRLVVVWQAQNTDDAGYYIVHPMARTPRPARDATRDWIIREIDRDALSATAETESR